MVYTPSGMTTSPANPSSATGANKSVFVSSEYRKVPSDGRLVHPQKARVPIDGSGSGKETRLSPLQLRKASFPITPTLSGIVTEVNPCNP